MNVVGSDSTESRRAASGLASMSISTCATVGQVGAHLVDHPAHRRARPAPDRAEVHDGRSGGRQPQVGRVDVGGLRRRSRSIPGPQREQPADHVRHAERGDEHRDHRRPVKSS